MNQESLIKERKEILDSIKSAFNELTNISKSESQKFKDGMAVLEEFSQRYLDLAENPTAIICKMGEEDEDIKEYVEKACKIIKDLKEAISTRTSTIRDPNDPNKRYKIDDNLIKSYKIYVRELNKYLALVYLYAEDIITQNTFEVLRDKLKNNKIGGFNKRRRETRKNKSKRKKSKRKNPKNKSKRKNPKNKSTRKTKH